MIVKKNNYVSLKEFKKIGFIAVVVLGIGAGIVANINANSPETVTQSLQEEGYKDIKITDFYFWCQKYQTGHRSFEAINPKGELVEGHLCESIWGKDIETTPLHQPVKLKM